MSRETIRDAILEEAKKMEIECRDLVLKTVPTTLASENEEERAEAKDHLHKYVYLCDLIQFLENEKYNPFTLFWAQYDPGAVPAYPEGKTIWQIDDTDIGIIEEDIRGFIFDVLDFMMQGAQGEVYTAIKPEVIKQEYISIIQRCIYEKHQEKK